LRVIGRGSAGVKLFDVAEGERIVSAVRLDEEEAPENEAEEAIVEEMVGRGSEAVPPANPKTEDEQDDENS
jgi:DNA gyrase subunit A